MSGSGFPCPVGASQASSRRSGVVDVPGREREVEAELRTGDRRGRPRAARPRAMNRVPERVPAARLDLEAGRAGMPAVPDEQVAARLEGRRQVEAGRPARGPDDVADLGADDDRPRPVLGQPGRDEPDDADRPRPAHDDRRLGLGRGGGDPDGLLDRRRASASSASRRAWLAASSRSARAVAVSASSASEQAPPRRSRRPSVRRH